MRRDDEAPGQRHFSWWGASPTHARAYAHNARACALVGDPLAVPRARVHAGARIMRAGTRVSRRPFGRSSRTRAYTRSRALVGDPLAVLHRDPPPRGTAAQGSRPARGTAAGSTRGPSLRRRPGRRLGYDGPRPDPACPPPPRPAARPLPAP